MKRWQPGRGLLSGVLACTLLPAIASAQTVFTAPPGYLTTGGTDFSIFPFRFRDGRVQLGDPTLTAQGKAMLTRVDYRTQGAFAYSPTSGMGRTWSSVTLNLAHTDCTKWSATFSQNLLGTPTLVYSAALTLPSHTGGTPTPTWGNAGSLPLSSSFAYDGTRHLLMDFAVQGGSFANGYSAGNGLDYRVDANRTIDVKLVGPNRSAGSKYVPKGPFETSRCIATGATAGGDVHALLQGEVYCNNHPTPSLRGRFRPQLLSYYTRPGTAVISAVTVGGSDAGVSIGAKCYPLVVNMAFALAITTKTTPTSALQLVSHLGATTAPWNNALAGINLYAQVAWEEPTRQQLGLSIGTKFAWPSLDLAGVSYPTGCVAYRYFDRTSNRSWPNATDATFGYTSIDLSTNNPIERFTTK